MVLSLTCYFSLSLARCEAVIISARRRPDVAFHKKAGLRVMDMVKSNWVYLKLRNFRAGTESTSRA